VRNRTRQRALVKEYSPVARRIRLAYIAAAFVPIALLAAACSSSSSTPPKAAPSATVPAAPKTGTLTETGSSLLFPLFGSWTPAYTAAHSGIKLSTASTSSGVGVTDAAQGLVNIGTSDEPLSASDTSQYPTLINVPLTVAGLMVTYNVTGLTAPLNLDGTVLAEIYTGKITTWNDPAIAALNPGVNLPSEKIVTIHRGDSSGSTVILTQYLNAQDPSGWPAADIGTSITWPSVPGALAETGSGAMVTANGSTPGSIAYVGVSYLSKVTAAKLSQAALKNGAGKYVTATPASLSAALASFPTPPASGSETLINTTAAAGFPITNYEYAIVNKTQTSTTQAALIQNFLTWAVTTGNSSTYLGPVGFVPLPKATLAIAKSLISQISG
jgi:phosphate transport system substrate-binding protein